MIALLGLAIAVCLIAIAYASVGLGGATAYAALLSLTRIPFAQIPPLVLTLNLLVAGSAFWGRHRVRLVPYDILLPLVTTSVPAAFLGGLVPLRERQFLLLLAVALLLAGVRFLFGPRPQREWTGARAAMGAGRLPLLLSLGAGLGLLSGMTGIGGGVYLGPILIMTGMTDLRTTPAVTSGFVLLNSVAGLGAHLTRVAPMPSLWIPLCAAVIVGAVAGTTISLRWFSPIWTRRTLGLVLMGAAILNGIKAL